MNVCSYNRCTLKKKKEEALSPVEGSHWGATLEKGEVSPVREAPNTCVHRALFPATA